MTVSLMNCCLRVFVTGLLPCFLLLACAPPEPLRIGFIGGLSGRASDLGLAGRNGFQLAVERINDKGGVRGRKIEIFVKDDGQDPVMARKAAEELAAAQVSVIIGPMTSAMVEPVLSVASEKEIVVLSPTVTSTAMTGKDDLFLRMLADTKTYADMCAKYHFERNRVRRVAAVFDVRNRAYSESWLTAFRDSFISQGGTMATEIPFESGDKTDHAYLIDRMLKVKPDALLFISGAFDTAQFAHHARLAGVTQVLFSAEWSATERLIELGGKAVDGIHMAQQFDRNDTSPGFRQFVSAYEKRFQTSPGFPSIEGYNAVMAVAEALERSPEGTPIKRALLEKGPFSGIQQPIVFDRFGDSQRPALHTIIRDGKFVVEN